MNYLCALEKMFEMSLKSFIKLFVPATYRKIDKSENKTILKLTEFQNGLLDKITEMQNNSMQKYDEILQKYDEILQELKPDPNRKNFLHNSLLRFIVEYFQILSLAQIYHPMVFEKYKDAFKGKTVYVIGSGPSLDKVKIPKDAIQIGVNGCCFSKNVNLDFLFVQDYQGQQTQEKFDNYKGNNCHRFYGMHYLDFIKKIPINHIENSAERYFFYDFPCVPFPYEFTFDISHNPFFIYGSTIFVALQFALYGHPNKICIVGCDLKKGHSTVCKDYQSERDYNFDFDYLMMGWEKFKNFASQLYPDVEIVSVNPVGLKGLFKDWYQDEGEEPK